MKISFYGPEKISDLLSVHANLRPVLAQEKSDQDESGYADLRIRKK
jgi:hypothetical protein